MRRIPWLEDGAVEAVGSEALVEVRGLHGLYHILGGELALGSFHCSLESRPHGQVLLSLLLRVSVLVNLLEVLCDRFVHLVSVAEQLVFHDDRSHYRIAALHPEDLLSCRVERLQVASSEVPMYLVQDGSCGYVTPPLAAAAQGSRGSSAPGST